MMLLNRRDHWTWKQTICINIQVGLWTGSYSCLISLFPLNRRALQTRFYCFSDKYILTSKAAAKKFSKFHFSFCWKSFFTLLLFFFFFGTHTNPLLMYHALTNTYRCSCIHIVCVQLCEKLSVHWDFKNCKKDPELLVSWPEMPYCSWYGLCKNPDI